MNGSLRSVSDAKATTDYQLDDLVAIYRQMLRIRRLEEAIAERYSEWRMRCPTHLCIGQEATAVGICHFLAKGDSVYSNHRGHGHYLAKGGDMNAMVAELYGKRDGCAGGHGGSMHLIDLEAGFAGSTPIVGGTVPLAVGSAWYSKLRQDGVVSVIFFGDGCFEEGVLHETMNFASLHRLPVLFVCENNKLSVYTRLEERQPERPLHQVARAHGLATFVGDGNDVLEIGRIAREAISQTRSGQGPQFIELATHRWLEHCGPNDDDDLGYRLPGELQHWQQRDPLVSLQGLLRGEFAVTEEALRQIESDIADEVAAAFEFAERSPIPEVSVSTESAPPAEVSAPVPGQGRVIDYAEAIREGLETAMADDPSVILIGEGVPDPKGIFGTTSGLRRRFGEQRVFDMPLAENGLTGICIGAALKGLRPVMVHQRIDFALLAMDQLVNNAAKLNFMFDGKVKVPLVVRLIVGRGWGQGPQHGQSLQALFAHIPGLKVVMPATAADAKGMLMSAVVDDGPVLFIEHRWLHHVQGDVPAGACHRPLQGAQVLRQGGDLTIAAFSHMVIEALKAAEWLAGEGLDVSVIDMRCVSPLDAATVAASVKQTGLLLVADTGHRKNGVASDLVARVVEQAMADMKSPPRIVSLPDSPLPTSRFLADHYYPDAVDIALNAMQMAAAETVDFDAIVAALRKPEPRDQPDRDFTGPF